MTNIPEKLVYAVSANVTGGREGHGTTTNPDLSFDLRMPPEMGGPGGGANPEALFAIGYGACFQGALGLAAKTARVDVSGSQVRCIVGIGPEGQSFALSVKMEVAIPGISLAEAQLLADETHKLCPYSKAIRGNVPVEVTAVEAL